MDYSERPYTVIQGNYEWVIIIEYVSLKGVSILLVVILKGKEQQATWYQEPAVPQSWLITKSNNS